ncbi:MAG: hypothetical protein COX32_00565, partial [Candidatus Moranbacteria bacterium CG23_combo_of_CG06-09_8_20_14_all_41_28]
EKIKASERNPIPIISHSGKNIPKGPTGLQNDPEGREIIIPSRMRKCAQRKKTTKSTEKDTCCSLRKSIIGPQVKKKN